MIFNDLCQNGIISAYNIHKVSEVNFFYSHLVSKLIKLTGVLQEFLTPPNSDSPIKIYFLLPSHYKRVNYNSQELIFPEKS